MRPPAFRKHNLCQPRQMRTGWSDERGVTIILVAFAMVGILAMAALSIDVITLYLARLEAQRSADAAALTAARLISISGITGDPDNSTGYWSQICGGETSPASQAAHALASQNTVSGMAISTANITVKYSGGGGPSEDCSTLGPGFGVNPMVTVQVTLASLPTFFARMWRAPSQTVTAAATAEAFNPSNSENVGNSGATGTIIPVQPRCVKPWVVPNQDPLHPITGTTCVGAGCKAFVSPTDSSIQSPGISLGGSGASGVIGETFTLFVNCQPGASCTMETTPAPQANVTGSGFVPGPAPATPNLEYLPGAVPSTSVAVPSCGNESAYQKAIAGCDQSTVYQCGVASAGASTPNTLDLSENPGGSGGDTSEATKCLIHQATGGSTPTGQDTLDTSAFPFKITAGTSNPVTGVQGSFVTSSNSIVSLPIYDSSAPLVFTGTTANITIVGFLQVFVNYVDANGRPNVTVLNVAGCGNGTNTTGPAVKGSSPVPVRLITPPSS